MHVLVTGATGFLGSHLCRAFVQHGSQVRALVRPSSSLALIQGLDIEHVIGDLMDPPSLRAAMRDIEVVLHCGAEVGGWKDRQAMIASHIVGTENIVHAARASGVHRLLYASSVAALGVPEATPPGHEPIPIDENHPWNYDPNEWPYGYAKHCAENKIREAAAAGLEALILNPAAIIGPGDKNLVASAIVYHMGRGVRPPIPPGGVNVVHVDDVVDGFLAATTRGRSGERYILGGENLPFETFLQEIASVIGAAPLRLRPPRWFFNRLAGLIDRLAPVMRLPIRGHILRMVGRHFYYDLSKSAQELGTSPKRSVREAVQAAHRWYLENPTLDSPQD